MKLAPWNPPRTLGLLSPPAGKFQEQVTGAPAGTVYKVNGVKFDGWSGKYLLEAKGPGYAKFLVDGKIDFASKRGADLLSQAQRQSAAAGSAPVKWIVAEKEMVAPIEGMLKEAGIKNITVEFQLPK